MTRMLLWSFSPLTRWVPQDSRGGRGPSGSAPLGGTGWIFSGGGGGGGRKVPRWRRLLAIMARRRRRRQRRE
ncbi:MAG: hypothetical protein ACYTGB_06060 [Planctomycetota bacterium]|jgi:hypothetical protein